jgi:hypothetical protein
VADTTDAAMSRTHAAALSPTHTRCTNAGSDTATSSATCSHTAAATTATTATAAATTTSEQRRGRRDQQCRYGGYCKKLGYPRHDDLLVCAVNSASTPGNTKGLGCG